MHSTNNQIKQPHVNFVKIFVQTTSPGYYVITLYSNKIGDKLKRTLSQKKKLLENAFLLVSKVKPAFLYLPCCLVGKCIVCSFY